ncbi:M50 family metallopeptidase [Paludifilum halophilum]|uniref:Peptidase M50 domain-containing protein n=1 Tax=Paludifilum halophilum TaxID=1642702 RepID=A0A235B7F2_9BACL|nr:M50 family metallopeptidase [Paludifilum halophilum]OYD08248.1 hypothetical protein CHM34_05185 [Paludifilum halophilum]
MNKWPWQGIEVRVHVLFWLVILSSVLTGRFMEVITLFVLVIIHEMGHITAAHSFGWRIRRMELLPFGGVAHTDEWGTVSAREEIVVALAGPFHNVMMVLAGILFFKAGWWSGDWTEYFIQGNTLMAGFNLLPVYPLDGGRILQSLLSYGMPYRKCILWTLWGSLIVALSFFLYAFTTAETVHLHLCMIALFLAYANWMALKQKEFQYVRFLMHRKECPPPDSARIVQLNVCREEPLYAVLKRMRKEAYHVFVVRDRQGRLCSLPEEVLLGRFFDDKAASSMIGDLVG